MTRRPFHAAFIDGMRAVAVLAVIAFHLDHRWLPGGFAGVDVFFVISGFVVALSISELGAIGLPRFLAYFYARRLVRIAPALVAMLLLTFLASALFIPQAWLSSANEQTGLFAFWGLSNFILAANTGNYFAPLASFNPFTHTWSLAVEEQFYLIFPWLFIAWLHGRRKASIGLFAAALVGSLLCAAWLARSNETLAFYMIWSRFWELGVGILLFQALHAAGHSFDHEAPARRVYSISADLGLLFLVTGLLLARADAAPMPASILPVAGTALLLGALHGRRGGLAFRVLTLRPMVFLGKISYSLYLWHWPVLVLFRWTVGLESPLYRLAALALTLALSLGSYFLVEQPVRNLARNRSRALVIATGLLGLGLSWSAASWIASHQAEISWSTVTRHQDLWYPEGPATVRAPNGCSVSSSGRQFAGGAIQVLRRTGCQAPRTFPHNVFVLGDSHAMAYTGMLRQLAARTGATVYQYNVGGCSFLGLHPLAAFPDARCEKFREASVQDLVPQVRAGDVVFLASLRIPRLVDQWGYFGRAQAYDIIRSEAAIQGRALGVEKAIPLLRELTSRGAHVVFEAPTPILESITFRCADWFDRNNPICSRGLSTPRSLIDDLRAPILQSYAAMRQAVPGVTVWDPLPVLCPGRECHAYRDGKPLLFDGDHLTYYSNMLLLPSFTAFVEGLDGANDKPAAVRASSTLKPSHSP
ncbi:MAG: acyltransferase [Betaproteobacteria bacterium]|nr:acyltransferase [Betaproteobacteria bacterium]